MLPIETYRQQRRLYLRAAMCWRRLIAASGPSPKRTKGLRGCQIQLLRLRTWRAHGVRPGNA